jgi:RsbT co-antagonist protein rsbRD N-terminal domain
VLKVALRRREMSTEGKKTSIHLTLVSQKLVNLIERNADELTNSWLADIRKDPNTLTYRQFDRTAIYERAFRVYSQLGKWISHETSKEEVAKDYRALGEERRREGFALSEVIQALILIRRNLWRKIMEEGLLDSTYDLYQAIELNNRVSLFFDRAIFFTACGYEQKTCAED